MSRRVCCVWGCSNKKGRCAEDIDGNRLCECSTLQTKDCPKRDILSLHYIDSMPQHVKQAVVKKINATRQGPRGNNWRPTKESVICNVHYADLKGPNRDNNEVLPVNFKRPRRYPSSIPAPKRKKLTFTRKEVTTRRKQATKSAAKLSHVNTAIPQADTALQVDCKEQQQSSAVESSTELVLPGNLSEDDLVDFQSSQVDQGNFSGDQGDMDDNATFNADVTVATSEGDTTQVNARIAKLQQENDDLHRDNDELRHKKSELCQRNDELHQENDELRQRNDELHQRNDELLQETWKLKQIIEDFNSNVQRINLKILSDYQVQMYTGISRETFECVTDWLKPVSSKKGAIDELSPSQKLLLVLMRLRHNLTQNDLACRFSIEQSSVSRILNNWIPLLSAQLRGLIKWPQTTLGPMDPPYNLLPNAVGIIDGTEIFIQRPSNLTTQKSSYSDYKSHTTVKYLVAIDTFTGVFIFVSPGFSGSSSDRFTIQNSGILAELKPGQRILADKGYNARDLFAQKRCFLTIPSFFAKWQAFR